MPWMRIVVATSAVTLIFFVFHVVYGQGWVADYVQRAAEAGRLSVILQQPYPTWFVTVASATAAVAVLAKVVAFHLVGSLLPGSIWFRGILFGCVLLLLEGELARMPLMNYLVGNPIDVVMLQSIERWVIQIGSGLLIAILVPTRLWQSVQATP